MSSDNSENGMIIIYLSQFLEITRPQVKGKFEKVLRIIFELFGTVRLKLFH